MIVSWAVRLVQEWSGLNRGIIPRHSFHPTHGSTLVDNDISLWQIQTNRQFHVGRDRDGDGDGERDKKTGRREKQMKGYDKELFRPPDYPVLYVLS